MNTTTAPAFGAAVYDAAASSRPHLDKKPGPVTAIMFVGLLAIGLLFTGYSVVNDVTRAGLHPARRGAADRARLRVRRSSTRC